MSSGWDKLDGVFVLPVRLAGRRCPSVTMWAGTRVAVMTRSAPSRRGCSLASDLAQNEGSWQQDGSILAPVEARVETEGSLREGD